MESPFSLRRRGRVNTSIIIVIAATMRVEPRRQKRGIPDAIGEEAAMRHWETKPLAAEAACSAILQAWLIMLGSINPRRNDDEWSAVLEEGSRRRDSERP